MPLSTAKRSEAMRQSLIKIIDHHGIDQCVDILLTFNRPRSLKVIKCSIRNFAKYSKSLFSAIVGVPGRSENASHVHLLAVCRDTSDPDALTPLVRKPRSKAGFASYYKVKHIDSLEGFTAYLADNLKIVLQRRSSIRGRKGGPVAVFCGIPRSLRIKPRSFTRLCPKSKRFRMHMNELARMAGVQIGDREALSSALRLSYREIVVLVNRIHLFFPCPEGKVSTRGLATAFPRIRRQYLEELNARGGDWTDPSEFNWYYEDEFGRN